MIGIPWTSRRGMISETYSPSSTLNNASTSPDCVDPVSAPAPAAPPNQTPRDSWRQARSQMLLDPEVANLNTGSFGPLPRPVFDHVTALRRRLAEEPMDFLVRRAPPLLWEARTQLASFLGGDPSRLIFTANVTASINTVAA